MDDSTRIAQLRTGSSKEDIADALFYAVDDHLGTSTLRLSGTATIIDRQEIARDSRRPLKNNKKPGQSGLYYYGARYYSAWSCRFINVDPLVEKTFYQSSYVYADNNPIMMNDPTGMESEGGGKGDPPNQWETKNDNGNTYTYIDGHWWRNYEVTAKRISGIDYYKYTSPTDNGYSVRLPSASNLKIKDYEPLDKKNRDYWRAKFDNFENPDLYSGFNTTNYQNSNMDYTMGAAGRRIASVQFYKDLLEASYERVEVVNIAGHLLLSVAEDENFLKREQKILSNLKARQFTIRNNSEEYSLGKRNSILLGGQFFKDFGMFDKDVWTFGHASFQWWATYNAQDNTFSIEYKIWDIFDLKPGSHSGISGFFYDLVITPFGFVHHDILGGNEYLQTRARFSITYSATDFNRILNN